MSARLTALLFLWLWLATAEAGQTFIIGVIPVHPTRVLVERYEPLRTYLEQRLQRPVRVESAADFARFQARTVAGDFDLTITPAHLARLAQTDAGYVPLARFEPDHDSLLVVSSEQPLTTASELRGKKLAVIDRLAITVMAALDHLDKLGLKAGQDYQVVQHRTHASAVQSLTSGISQAAVSTSQGLLQIPEDQRSKLRIIEQITNVPAFVFLGKPGAETRNQRLKSLLLAFPAEMEGLDFLGHTGYTRILATNEASMQRSDRYLKETRRLLAP
jgi:phosphonate transport system substrate-binding protein